jgi:hypothetical protein
LDRPLERGEHATLLRKVVRNQGFSDALQCLAFACAPLLGRRRASPGSRCRCGCGGGIGCARARGGKNDGLGRHQDIVALQHGAATSTQTDQEDRLTDRLGSVDLQHVAAVFTHQPCLRGGDHRQVGPVQGRQRETESAGILAGFGQDGNLCAQRFADTRVKNDVAKPDRGRGSRGQQGGGEKGDGWDARSQGGRIPLLVEYSSVNGISWSCHPT